MLLLKVHACLFCSDIACLLVLFGYSMLACFVLMAGLCSITWLGYKLALCAWFVHYGQAETIKQAAWVYIRDGSFTQSVFDSEDISYDCLFATTEIACSLSVLFRTPRAV